MSKNEEDNLENKSLNGVEKSDKPQIISPTMNELPALPNEFKKVQQMQGPAEGIALMLGAIPNDHIPKALDNLKYAKEQETEKDKRQFSAFKIVEAKSIALILFGGITMASLIFYCIHNSKMDIAYKLIEIIIVAAGAGAFGIGYARTKKN